MRSDGNTAAVAPGPVLRVTIAAAAAATAAVVRAPRSGPDAATGVPRSSRCRCSPQR